MGYPNFIFFNYRSIYIYIYIYYIILQLYGNHIGFDFIMCVDACFLI